MNSRLIISVAIVAAILALSITGSTFILHHSSLQGTSSSSSTLGLSASIIISSSMSASLSTATTDSSTTSSSSSTVTTTTTNTFASNPSYWIAPRTQTTYNGYVNVTACISYPPVTYFFIVHLTAPNGTIVFSLSEIPNTQDGFTFINNTWCRLYDFGQRPFPRLDVQGIWTVSVVFSTRDEGYKASATINYV